MEKILILGGGFGGVRCALDLEKKLKDKAEITLIDKKSYHLFAPSLYEVASAYGIKEDLFAVRLKKTISIPYSDIFENKNINFVQAEISSVDLGGKEISTRGGETFDYDYLVLALGSQAADFGVPGVNDYAYKFKNLEDALALNKKIGELTQEIAVGRRTPPIKIAVVGAGFTGIEVAAEFACCVKKLSKACLPSDLSAKTLVTAEVLASSLRSQSRFGGVGKGGGIKGKCERIMLLEAGPKILPTVSDGERKAILKRLTRLGIEVMESAAVEEVGSDFIKLKNGKHLDIDMAIWTAGIRLPDLLAETPSLPLTDLPARLAEAPAKRAGQAGKKRIKVNNDLGLEGRSGIFAVGDSVEFVDPKTNKTVPALAYVAVDQGKIVAKNILRLINSKKPIEYDSFYGVWIAPVGGKYALAHLWRGVNIKGFWGWILREIVDFKYMLSILPARKAFFLMWREITLFTKND